MHFTSLEKQKSVNSGIYAKYAIDSLFSEKADWRLRKDPVVPAAVNQCISTCEAPRSYVFGVQRILNAGPFLN
jgi:hypothetical protein